MPRDSGPTGQSILLVEDNQILAAEQRLMLESHGLQVTVVHSGEDAVAWVERDCPFRLVLMDVVLGRGMSGIEAARRILDVRDVPVVFLTAHSEQAYIERIEQVTRYGYLLKGTSDAGIVGAVRAAIDLHERNRRRSEHDRLTYEQSLQRRTSLLEKAEEIAGVGSWEWDIVQDEWTMSANWYRIHGLANRAMSTDELLELAHPEDRPRVAEAFRHSVAEGRPYDIEHRIVRRDTGEIRTVHALGEVWTSEHNGRPIRLIGSVQDITERKEAERLQSELRLKDRVLRELNHRVKNNLNLVSSLISLKDAALGESADLSDIRNQVGVISLLHEKLYEGDQFTHIDLKPYLSDLLATVVSLYPGANVAVSVDVPDVSFPAKKAMCLGLILNELATNAMKYGFAEEVSPTFTVRMARDAAEGICVLTASNSGRAFPESIDIERPSTLGLQLVSALVEDVDGEMTLRRSPEPEFTIRFSCREEPSNTASALTSR